jgi:hypothetical protein
MPIPLPNLDDRSYADLTAQAQSLIPSLYPEWTNHNPSDPGITLVELLAWLTEMLMFQVDQIPPANTGKFLKLLNGPPPAGTPAAASPPATPQSLDDAIRQTITGLRERYRAVTPGDWEWLALETWPQTDAAGKLPGGGKLARVHFVPRRDLSATDPAQRSAVAQAHVSLVVMPQPVPAGPAPASGGPAPGSVGPAPAPAAGAGADSQDALFQALWQFFDERRLLTVRHHVVGPAYLPVQISANLALREDAPADDALAQAHDALVAYYDPLTGGSEQAGWPFGRPVYASEASAVLERVSLVDYVEDVQVTAPGAAGRVQTDADGTPVAVQLDADELVQLSPTALVAYDVRGQRFQET